jgi:hypothetical protein
MIFGVPISWSHDFFSLTFLVIKIQSIKFWFLVKETCYKRRLGYSSSSLAFQSHGNFVVDTFSTWFHAKGHETNVSLISIEGSFFYGTLINKSNSIVCNFKKQIGHNFKNETNGSIFEFCKRFLKKLIPLNHQKLDNSIDLNNLVCLVIFLINICVSYHVTAKT